jgi:glucoamylase
VQTNATGDPMSVPIGRYPEDTYSGGDARTVGNPWFLATNAFAELYFLANQPDKAHTFLRRTRYHSGGATTFSEQFSRQTGFMMSAPDLTWNYASFLSIN